MYIKIHHLTDIRAPTFNVGNYRGWRKKWHFSWIEIFDLRVFLALILPVFSLVFIPRV